MEAKLHLTLSGSADELAEAAGRLAEVLRTGAHVTIDRKAPVAEQAAPEAEQAAPEAEQKAPEAELKAPEAEQAPATGSISTVDLSVGLDSRGLPWDQRIHSGAQTKLVNGHWKLIRGVDKGLVAQVEGELSAGGPWAEPTQTPVEQAPSVVEQAAPEAEQAPADTPPAVEQAPAGGVVSITDFNTRVMAAMGAGEVSHTEVTEMIQTLGCANFGVVAAKAQEDPTLTGRILAALGL